MDNSNNLSSSILQSSEPSFPSSSVASTSLSGDDSGFFESLKNVNMTTWLLIILILAFLGFNIFVYLAKGTQDLASFFGPITQKLFGTTAYVAGQTVDVAAEGAKAVVSGTATTVNTGLSAVQDITPNNATSSIQSQPVQGQPTSRPSDNGLNKALNNSQEQNMDYQAVEASSSVHSGGGQSGWCFVGEDRGFRSCALVNEDDKCMSGDIFPSQELCINPNLRA
jgi:nitrogen fixation protein FixH